MVNAAGGVANYSWLGESPANFKNLKKHYKMQNRQHTVSELQAILYKMDYYKLTNGFIGVCTKGGTPDFYESKPSFTMFSWEPVSREDVLKMIDEATEGKEDNSSAQPLYKALNQIRTKGNIKVFGDYLEANL